MSTTEVVLHQPPTAALAARDWMPVFDIELAVERKRAVNQFIGKILNEGTDFGSIPGTNDKKVLLKPGAEKLCSYFGFSQEFILEKCVEDWNGTDHNKEPFFYYLYKCRLMKNGRSLGEGDGSCNSWESKYRWRNGSRKCPQCGQEAIIAGKKEYGGGFLCFKKKNGCGAKFGEKDPAITGQEVGRIANPDIADVVNTIQKMAQKRALIQATLLATNASDAFTQDLEDFQDLDGPAAGAETHEQLVDRRITEEKAKAAAPAPRATQQQPPPADDPMPLPELAPRLKELLLQVSSPDKYKRLAPFQALKGDLQELAGEQGEALYYEILGRNGVQKSDQFKLMGPAKKCITDLFEAVQKAAAPAKEAFVVSDSDVPANIGGRLFEKDPIPQEAYGVD